MTALPLDLLARPRCAPARSVTTARSPGAAAGIAFAAWFGLIVAVSHGSTRAQGLDCEVCAGQSACGSKHKSCVAECRARLFSIDPRRASCISICVEAATVCAQSVENRCRLGKRCL